MDNARCPQQCRSMKMSTQKYVRLCIMVQRFWIWIIECLYNNVIFVVCKSKLILKVNTMNSYSVREVRTLRTDEDWKCAFRRFYSHKFESFSNASELITLYYFKIKSATYKLILNALFFRERLELRFLTSGSFWIITLITVINLQHLRMLVN